MDQYEVLDQTWKGSLALHSRYVSKVARDMTLPLLCSGISGHEKYSSATLQPKKLSELAADSSNCSCCSWLPSDEGTASVLDWMDKQESKPNGKRLGAYALVWKLKKGEDKSMWWTKVTRLSTTRCRLRFLKQDFQNIIL
ncbi:uncharacterized protein LOC119324409 [Triticum dicoccoides]|uniref:uncharacterized protein LOC119270830 n=1 Tax=Triticum dicoccoides TaxID=85692 RepID=UPI00188DE442|nr:uncharacterized protein LOC119270830 [Triticum dicoccoides]XP_037408787.1 uncharacterized protein LOC119270830 [Triticum dicoccoides]XP_037408794.1 uncharacterized protein LOC119270830 [Triticum dicoccoides]XP_037450772.1 uncharacterized protein LOC119321006 [Triticum dicoccoides]XP_037454093.1 uncharacterized protein LOC119324409 [Triticum dicoccoides]XP_044396761.1 uncharacterized protein LOC123120837 [Triticum aestivum]